MPSTQARGGGNKAPLICNGGSFDVAPISIQDVTGRDKGQNGKGWNDDGTSYTVDSCATQGVVAPALKAEGFDASEDGTGRGTPLVPVDLQNCAIGEGVAGTLDTTRPTRGGGQAVMGMRVRRLLPIECERLQGFPDGWTLVPYRGKPASDGPRYKAIGNSMAVNVMRWLGRRIAMVDAVVPQQVALAIRTARP